MKFFFTVLISIYCIGFLLLLMYSFIFTGSTNHSSFPITSFILYYGAIGFLISFIFIALTKDYKNGIKLIVLSVVVLVFAVIANLYNIMIEYDLWIEREMPDKYTFLFNMHKSAL